MTVIPLPNHHQDFAAARAVLHSPHASRDQITMACTVLAASRDWMDLRLASDMRNAMWANRASDLRPEDRAVYHQLGQNAALFAALNHRRNMDRWGWIIAALALAGTIAMAAL